MFDTHAHLNFKRFKKTIHDVIEKARATGIVGIVIPGTDIATSKKAIELSQSHDFLYASVGIHPHHVKKYQVSDIKYKEELEELEHLLQEDKVVAVGEVGMDRHSYEKTKYDNYKIDKKFIDIQKTLLNKQIQLAIQYKKSLILHNREAVDDLLAVLTACWEEELVGRTVFHCCEPEKRLLEFALDHNMFIGVDGDVTYDKTKQLFAKEVPIEHLVIETDSPFILPEPLKSQKEYPNEPKNLTLIVKTIARLKNLSIEKVSCITTENAMTLFNMT